MNTQVLPIDLIKTDGDTQNRVTIHQDTVEEYCERISEAKPDWPYPPVDVFHDGSEYFVGDGFHRVLAGQRAKRGSIPCNVHKGTARDARIFGMTANDKHGMRLTREDKRACVEWLLDNGGKMAQRAIAETAGVSLRTVQLSVADRKAQFAHFLPRKEGKSATQSTQSADLEGGEEPTIKLHKDPPKVPKKGKPPKKFDRAAYYKQWTNAIGPLMRLVAGIGRGVDEHDGTDQRDVKKHLGNANAAMAKWMKVTP